MSAARDVRPLIAHVVYRFDTGGLENGLANLINRMPPSRYRHAVIALTQVTAFSKRVRRDDVAFIELDKPPGHGVKLYPRLYRLFREMKPQIVHTRNLAALEAAVPAALAGVPVRIHGEHGRDIADVDGSSRKYRWIRALYRPFVTHYVAVSHDLERYLAEHVGVSSERVTQIYNGVDAQRFSPATQRSRIAGAPFGTADEWIVGTVGRSESVKDPLTLARAFVRALEVDPAQRARMRLALVGDGPLRERVQAFLAASSASASCWVPGERSDVPAILRGLDCFVLPSLGEGISNTILEAMACGLPVIATDVGGNRELVEHGVTGTLVPAADPEALAHAILDYARDPQKARRAGEAGRARVERLFSLDAMIERYTALYDRMLGPLTPQLERMRPV